jgi:ribosome-binding factor A
MAKICTFALNKKRVRVNLIPVMVQIKHLIMETTRQQKVARLIQKEIAEIFQTETHLIPNQSLITVTRVSVTKDLSIARIFLSVFSGKNKKFSIHLVEEKNKEIRYKLAQRVKHQLRIVPELTFFLDDTLDYLENIENLLKK